MEQVVTILEILYRFLLGLILGICVGVLIAWWWLNRQPKWVRDHRRENQRIYGKPISTSRGSITEEK